MSTNENTPISGQFWDWMQSYWHSNRDFPPAHPDWRKKADLVNGKVPAGQLPSYVDDVLEFSSYADLPQSGEKGKIYITTKDNKQFRWGGSAYLEINSGENVMTLSTEQSISGRKYFVTSNGSDILNQKLWLRSFDGSNPAAVYYKDGYGSGALGFDGDEFRLTNVGTSAYAYLNTKGIKKDNSNDDHVLTGGGGHISKNDLGASHIHQSLFSEDTGNTDANSLLKDYKLTFNQRVERGSTNMFPTVNNANSILSIASHPGGYGGQLGFNGEERVFFRGTDAGNYGIWKEFAFKDWVTNNFLTKNTLQDITATKRFFSFGNNYYNHTLQIYSDNSSNPSAVFYKDGINIGQLAFDGGGFHFVNDSSTGYFLIKAGGFIRNGSDDNYILLGGGGHKLLSDLMTTNTTQTIDMHKTFSGGLASTRYEWSGSTTTPAGKVSKESAFFNLGSDYGYGISTNIGGGLDIMANQGGQPIRFWAGNGNNNPFNVVNFYKEIARYYTNISIDEGKEIRLKGPDDIAHYIKHFSDDTDGFGVSTGFAVKFYNDSSKNLLLVDGSGTYVNGNRVWDLGNFNPEWKAERENNAVGIGFEGGNIENPYMKHNAGAAYLATKSWITSSFIPKTHPTASIGQSQINGWNNSISKSSASEEVILEADTLKIQPDEFSLEGSGSYDIGSRKKLVHVLLREGKEVNIRELVRRQTMVVFNFSKDPVSLNIEGLKPYALSPGMQVTLYISDEGEVLLYNETGFKKLQ